MQNSFTKSIFKGGRFPLVLMWLYWLITITNTCSNNPFFRFYYRNYDFKLYQLRTKWSINMNQRWRTSEDLLIHGRSISRPTCSNSSKPSISGIWTSVMIISILDFSALKNFNCSIAELVDAIYDDWCLFYFTFYI